MTGLSVGSTSGTDGGTNINGTSAGGTQGGNVADDEISQVDNTPDAPAGAVQCGVTCDSNYNNKTIACEGGSKIELYECKNGAWTQKGSVPDCSDFTAPSSHKKIGKWTTGFVFAGKQTEISGTSPKAWQIANYCEACESGKYKKNGSCVKDNRCTADDGKKYEAGTTGTAACKNITNSKECTWKCSNGKWAEPKLTKCNDGYTVKDNACVKDKVTVKLYDVIKKNGVRDKNMYYDIEGKDICRGITLKDKYTYYGPRNMNSATCQNFADGGWGFYTGSNFLRGESSSKGGSCKCRVVKYGGRSINSSWCTLNYFEQDGCAMRCALAYNPDTDDYDKNKSCLDGVTYDEPK